jgi:hypothetical protein
MSRHALTLVLSFALVGCGAAAESDPEDDAAEDVDTTEEALGECNCTPGVVPANMTCFFQCLDCSVVESSSCGAWGRAPRDGGCDAGAHAGWRVENGSWVECTPPPPPPDPCGCGANMTCLFQCLMR